MKFTTVFTFLTLCAASVYATHYETNASRLARGLPPMPPVRRSSTWSAKRTTPSSVPRSCGNTQSVQCCNTVTHSSDQRATTATGLLGIVAPVSGLVGFGCSPLSVIGASGNSCTAQSVCCEDNHFSGLIATGCSPINVNA